jgi:hypothetical protein
MHIAGHKLIENAHLHSPMPSSNSDLRAIGAWQSNIKFPKTTELEIGGKSAGTSSRTPSSKTYTTGKGWSQSAHSSPWSSLNRRT